MATRIIEYGGIERNDGLPIVPMPVRSQTAMTATGTSAQSAATGTDCDFICIQSDEAVYIKRGANPTATADDYRIPAGGEQFFDMIPGYKVAIRT
jgi:hypothetical protein